MRTILKTLTVLAVGLVSGALFYPYEGVMRCVDGAGVGRCDSFSTSLLIRYEGHTDIGVVIALAVGVVAALLAYFLLGVLMSRRRTPGLSGDGH